MANLLSVAALFLLTKQTSLVSACQQEKSADSRSLKLSEKQQEPLRYRAHRLSPTSKIVHFVRHAEGHHNVAGRKNPVFGYMSEDLEDAELTEKGVAQCKKLSAESAPLVENVQLVVTSPLRRTMQTASHTFPQLKNNVPWIAIESIREQTGLHPCDRRLPITEQRKSFPHIDFASVESDADPLYALYTLREPAADVQQRGREFMLWLQSRPEKEIIVVSHAGYLRNLFGNVLYFSKRSDAAEFANCEMRTIIFDFEQKLPVLQESGK